MRPSQTSPHSVHGPRLTAIGIALAVLGAWACSDTTGSSMVVFRKPSDVQVIALDSTAPALESDSVSFYAVLGEDRSGEIYFDSAGVRVDRLLRFEVDKWSLYRLPNGQRIRAGDSVLISIRVNNPSSLQFDFAPAGLRFKSDDPAILTIGYGRALNAVIAPAGLFRDAGDEDHHAETDLAIWLQELPSSPFIRLASDVDTQAKEITAEVPGFSRYAVAY